MSDILEQLDSLTPERRALLARHLQKNRRVVLEKQTIPRLPRKGKSDTFPLSFGQERLWFLHQLEPCSSAYNAPAVFRLIGPLNQKALDMGLSEVVRRHEVLRTTFMTVEGRPVQVIAAAWNMALSMVDLRQLPKNEQENQERKLVIEEVQSPFDLSQGPLFRAKLLRLAKEEHLLLLSVHHLVADGWSVGVFAQEVAQFYKAFSTGQPSPLPELPIQYADFAHWQRQWLSGEILETQLSYWKQHLGGNLPVLSLPTDRPRSTVQTFRGGKKSFVLSKPLPEALVALSRREGVTLFMTLLAAFETLLYRYTGQQDIIVGSPIANRNLHEIEELIGFFLNTLALRINLSDNPSFRQLLKRVRQVALAAYAHQDLPFEKLVEELRPQRDLSVPPLFQVMFVLQNEPMPVVELLGLSFTPLAIEPVMAKFDLTLSIAESKQGLTGALEYNTDLFDADTIDRMLRHFHILLKGIVADTDLRLSDLPVLTEAEQHQLLVEWNQTQTNYPKDSCIHELFEAQVEQTPDAIAIVFEDEHLTYRQLNHRANQLAHYLMTRRMSPDTYVGISVDRSVELVVGLLGILKAGCAYVPVDPTYPQERLEFMMEDSQVSVLLTKSELVARLPTHRCQVVCLDSDWQIIGHESAENPIKQATPENLAYVIYTSGSTGKPKGVLGRHKGAVNRFNWMWETYPFGAEEICCQKTSLNFVDSVWEIFGPLLRGVRTVIISDEVLKEPHKLVHILAANQITRIGLVPSLLKVILDTHADLQSRLPLLKYWISSGEPLSKKLSQRFLQSMPQAILLNLYGSSEVSADATWYDTGQESKDFLCVPIGSPIANTQIALLDAHLQPVPVGVPGELCVGGIGLARGYLNRPELTAEKFIPNFFIPDPSAHLYRTGDLARYLPDGKIEFLGRIDHQVKIRGFRIELAEIAVVLEQHPNIQETVVLAREEASGERYLVAYVVFTQEQVPTISQLRHFLKKKLPEYMVPTAFVSLESLPTLPNGKVDRRALPVPKELRPELEVTYVVPRTKVEQTIAEVWQEVLRVEKVGINANFFDLGGHSLLMVQIHTKLQEIFQRDLPVIEMFRHPTVSSLAESFSKDQSQQPSFGSSRSRAETRRALMKRERQFRPAYRGLKK